MTFDPARLFEPHRATRAPSDAAELDAVAAGKKPLSMFVTAEDELAEWVALAAQRNLVVTFHADPTLEQLHVFVARTDQQWRIPAYLALWETAFVDGRWSDASENLAGYLLGYTKPQRKAWLAAQHQAFPAWTAMTVYALLTREQCTVIEALGRKSFDFRDGLTVFVHRGGVLKPSAFSIIPRDRTLVRVGVKSEVAAKLFEPSTSATIGAKHVPKLNAALLSEVQFLTKAGWR
jgi:hypothetical protein